MRRWSKHGVIKSYRIGPRGDRRFKREYISILLFGKAEGNGAGANPGTSNAE